MPVTPLRILVVTGARVLDVDERPRRWARGLVAHWMTIGADGRDVGLVVHGDAPGPDRYAEDLAGYLLLPRVVFRLVEPGVPILRSGTRAREVKDAGRYRYDARDPLARNAAMVRWAADRRAEGHDVVVLALTAPWSNTNGARYTMARAKELELPVMHFDAPDHAWPREEGAG